MTIKEKIKNMKPIKPLWVIMLLLTVLAFCLSLIVFYQIRVGMLTGDANPPAVVEKKALMSEMSPSYDYSVVNTDPNAEIKRIAKLSEPMKVRWNNKPVPIPSKDSFYFVGRVENTQYKGYDVLIQEELGMDTYYVYHIVNNAEHLVYRGEEGEIAGIFDGTYPETIKLPGTKYTYRLASLGEYLNVEGGSSQTFLKTFKEQFEHPILGKVYKSPDSTCLYFFLPNNMVGLYTLENPFEKQGDIKLSMPNGKTQIETYEILRPVCGGRCAYFNPSLVKPEDMVLAGTFGGEQLYKVKDRKSVYLQSIYDDTNTMAYMTDEYKSVPTNKYSYDEFINYNPLLFWKDPFGQWVEFKNVRFTPAAEMCKPIIYLYPEKTQKISVQVAPNGGITTSIPPYNKGWSVIASPDGTLKNLGDNKTYTSLFWEGVGLDYPISKSGEVVAREDLNTYLTNALASFGLNTQEAKEFKTYWLRRLQVYPYYQIYFLNPADMDRLAPLTVDPAPKTVIRVMMTARGLDKKLSLPAYPLPVYPERTGYTLVEWGGAELR